MGANETILTRLRLCSRVMGKKCAESWKLIKGKEKHGSKTRRLREFYFRVLFARNDDRPIVGNTRAERFECFFFFQDEQAKQLSPCWFHRSSVRCLRRCYVIILIGRATRLCRTLLPINVIGDEWTIAGLRTEIYGRVKI